jgi:hypothetical protein
VIQIQQLYVHQNNNQTASKVLDSLLFIKLVVLIFLLNGLIFIEQHIILNTVMASISK